jgi:hypothetical protein
VDGGSTDATLEIARRYRVDRVLPNPPRTGESGYARLQAGVLEWARELTWERASSGFEWALLQVAAGAKH